MHVTRSELSVNEVIRRYSELLTENGVRHFLCGGTAVNILTGEIRYTSDVDFAAFITKSKAEKIFKKVGLRLGGIESFDQKDISQGNFVMFGGRGRDASGEEVRIDLLTEANPWVAQGMVFSEKNLVVFSERVIPVATREVMVAAKIISFSLSPTRQKDRQDLLLLLSTGTVDVEKINKLLGSVSLVLHPTLEQTLTEDLRTVLRSRENELTRSR